MVLELLFLLMDNGDMVTNITEFCVDDCYTFDKNITLIITNNTRAYCGNSMTYTLGCAVLQNDTAVVSNFNSGAEQLSDINHELLHLYLWKSKRDYTHSKEFVESENRARDELGLYHKLIWVEGR